MKLLGAAAVLTACIIAGIMMSGELKERVRCLKELQQSAIYIKSDLEYRTPVFEDCFNGRGNLFGKAAVMIKNGELPKDALIKAANEIKPLAPRDREMIYAYADGLCAEEVGGQTANISLLITRLEQSIREAEEETSVKGRLYRSGGILAGIGFVIILL